MDELQSRLVDTLRRAAQRLRKAGLPHTYVAQMEQLVGGVGEPCVVAVVGRVKMGKSTFVNALLGEDLAKVGATETTATINYFRHGTPNPDFPVRCHWRAENGGVKVTDESRAFLDSLQGNESATLRKAGDIEYLEYLVPNDYLKQITLVDTPGTEAVVAEHQQRIEEFVDDDERLRKELQQFHYEETRRLGSDADAVLYLIGVTAKMTDEALLKRFQAATGDSSRAYNTIGVMTQIDLDAQVIERRAELARKAALQLQDRLNTVMPVSAGVERALARLLVEEQAGLRTMIATFRRNPPLPPAMLKKLLSASEAYDTYEAYFDADGPCPITPEQRQRVRGKRAHDAEPDEIPWETFATLVRTVTDPSLPDAQVMIDHLRAITGFEQLRTILEQYFVTRGSWLRSYNLVSKALKLLKKIRDNELPTFYKVEYERQEKRKRFMQFLNQFPNHLVAKELETFVEQSMPPRTDLGAMLEEVEREIGHIKFELWAYIADFRALKKMEEHESLFTPAERTELRTLLGLYELESGKRLPPSDLTLASLGGRQEYWERKSHQLKLDPSVIAVAEQAVRRYGMIAEDVVSRKRNASSK